MMRAQQSIVATALRLWNERPSDPVLQILDDAMAGHGAEELEFAFDYDDLHPPHPFAELLRRAFAPQLDPTILLISTLAAEVDDHDWPPQFQAAQQEWHAVIMRFADRYGIWGDAEPGWKIPRASGAAASTTTRH